MQLNNNLNNKIIIVKIM